MKLSKVALLALRGSTPEVKERIATALNVSDKSVYRYLLNNDDSLTKAAVMKIIREETGLEDSQILEEVSQEEAQETN